jgi:hypothetical protein
MSPAPNQVVPVLPVFGARPGRTITTEEIR